MPKLKRKSVTQKRQLDTARKRTSRKASATLPQQDDAPEAMVVEPGPSDIPLNTPNLNVGVHEYSFINITPGQVLHGELDIEIMDYISQILKVQFHCQYGMLPLTYLHSMAFEKTNLSIKIPLNADAVQMHYITGHYLLSARRQKTLYVYDSLPHPSHIGSVQQQLCLLYEQFNPDHIKYITPQHQGASLLCGLFVVANAVCLLSNVDPNSINFDTHKMRSHLHKCLQDGVLSNFPQSSKGSARNISLHEQLLQSYFKDQRQKNIRLANRKRHLRANEDYRKQENLKRQRTRSTQRAKNDYRKQENLKQKRTRTLQRDDSDYRKQENLKQKRTRTLQRDDSDYRKQENLKRKRTRTLQRDDSAYRTQENLKRKRTRTLQRDDSAYRKQENLKRKRTRTLQRDDTDYREQENLKRKKIRTSQRDDSDYREEENLKRKKTRTLQRDDSDYREQENLKQKRTRTLQRDDSDYREQENLKRKRKRKELPSDATVRIQIRETQQRNQRRRTKTMDFEVAFIESKKQFPAYICCCCHRTWYRQSVQILSLDKYVNITQEILHHCITDKSSIDGNTYICSSCHQSLMKNRMPATSTANRLRLDDRPKELTDLGELESVLISQRIIFFKMINLPRGRQKGLIGSFVNIPVDTENVCATLPRTPNQTGIIPLKLKRKISYKGHHIHQNIRPEVVIQALNWLVHNNKLYQNITSRSDWIQDCQEEDDDLWDSLVEQEQEAVPKNPSSTNSVNTTSVSSTDTNNTDTTNETNNEQDSETSVQSKVAGVQHDTCLHPNNLISSSDKQYSIAPGEGKSPLDPFLDSNCEALAFPHLFPSGCFTLMGEDKGDNKRKVSISSKKYFIQRITNHDNRFASSIPYLFYALNVCEKQQIQSLVTIAIRKARRKDIAVGDLKNPGILHDIMIKDQAFQFLSQVRGSPVYWQHVQYELLAMVRAKGIFTWFLTLSCADLQWPETIQAIGLQNGQHFTDEDIAAMSYEEKCHWLRQNPTVAARQFDHRLQSFFKDVIQSPSAPLGKVSHYFQRTEFQLRGSPHCHAVLWVEDAPNLDKSTDDEICTWIDKYISCDIPPADDPLYDEVCSKQQHTHSVACKKHNTSCRFHYPKPPSERTILAKPDDNESTASSSAEHAKLNLWKINEILTDNTFPVAQLSLEQLLSLAGIPEQDYYKALQFSKSGKSIVHKRQPNSININNYNETILRNWKANMDLQFVCDPYACISYIVSYVTKDEREMSQMLKEAAKEMKNADVKARLRKVGNIYLNNREISAQEAAYRLLSIPLKRCSSKLVWIPTDLPDDRIGILKPQAVLDTLEDEDTNIYSLGIVDKYINRPTIPQVDQLCLWEFASWYDSTAAVSSQEIQTHEDTTSLPKAIMLRDGQICMRKRSTPAIPRYHVFSIHKETEKFYHQQLMLFLPWRNEESDLKDLTNIHLPYQAKYDEVADLVQETKHRLEHHTDLVDNALRNYDVNGPPQHAWDLLDSEMEQSTSDDARRMQQDDDNDPHNIRVAQRSTLLAVTTRPNALKDNELRNIIHMLNKTQRAIFDHIIGWCKQAIASRDKPDPFHLFVTGGAGTGKSQLIKAIYHQASRILQVAGDNPDNPVILLTSPTGTASYNIGGTTLHAALHLPMGRYYSLKSNPSLLASFQNSLSQLQILVIDEISMVGRTMLAHIHRRLQEAKGTDEANSLFGGVSILAVGDFYQLPPVHQHKLFDCDIADTDNIDQEELAVVLAGLWENFSVVQLTQVMRQMEDVPFAEMLNRLRTATHIPEDLSFLKSKIISPSNPEYPKDALHIYPTRDDVDKHNTIMLKQIHMDKIELCSITKVPNVVKNFDHSQLVAGIPNKITICINARIMLIKNIDVADGLVNGATGTILDIVHYSHPSPLPKALIIKFDNTRVGRMTKQSSSIPVHNYTDGVPILPVEVKQHIGRSNTSPEVTRIQFPVVLCWACTIHKVQGATLDRVVISFKKLRTKGQAYVAFSRVSSSNGLFLLDFRPDSIKCDEQVTEEMDRLCKDNYLNMATDQLAIQSKQPNSVRLCFFNIQSLRALHQADLRHDLIIHSSDVLAVTETWLQTGETLSIPGYTSTILSPRSSGCGGGAAILTKTGFRLTKLQINTSSNIDAIAANISFQALGKRQVYTILLMYCPPRTPIMTITSCIQDFINRYTSTYPLIVGGDFNYDLNKTHNSITSLLQAFGFAQVTDSPTHQSGSHIDHIWTTLSPIPMPVQLWTYYSDHKQLYLDLPSQ